MAMNWSDVVELIRVVNGVDDDGFPVDDLEEKRRVFANRKSVKSSEYYAAKQSGIELSYIFELRSVDYDGEVKLKYNDEPYEVERSYEKGEFIELTCNREGDNHEL